MRRVRELGESARHVPRALHVSDKTIRKWVARAAADAGALADRSSRPARPMPPPPRRWRWDQGPAAPAPLTTQAIAETVGVSRATMARIVARCGWARLHVLELPPTSRRYERAQAGELVHLDVKKLARIVRRRLGVRHLFTRPYTPRTNGKVERFIQTALRAWAYVRLYRHSEDRARPLTHWRHRYNWHRGHTALDGQPPHQPGRSLCGQPDEASQLVILFDGDGSRIQGQGLW